MKGICHISFEDYLYDADGERVWKFTGTATATYSSGQIVSSSLELDKTFYPTQHVTIDNHRLYKHYFIGGERICTEVTMWNALPILQGNHVGVIHGNASQFVAGLGEQVRRALDSVGYNGDIAYNQGNYSIPGSSQIYYYHYNHQGCVALVTNMVGTLRQHLQYLPYGGIFVDHRTGSYSSTYTFSAKEKDSESGYTYFGARYYSDGIMRWLSVDPMSDKNASTSPYMYCAGNPIKYKDLYGMDTIMFNRYGYFGKPIPDNSDEDTYVRVSNKEFNANKIKYKKNGGLRWYHGTLTIGKNELVKKESDYGDMYYDAGKDKNKASKIFRFFVNNTDVEWSHSIWNDDNNELLNAISTNHDAKEVDFPRLNKIPVHFFHSHPDGGQVSDQDVEILNRMMKINPNFVSTIYKGGYFTDYDVNKKEFNKRIKPW